MNNPQSTRDVWPYRRASAPDGFELVEDLASRGGPWIDGLSQQLLPAAPHQHVNSFQYPAYFTTEGAAMAAVGRADGGIGVPNHLKLTDEQLVSLIKESGCSRVAGHQEFCERVERLADTLGRKVSHPYQPAPTSAQQDPAADPAEPVFDDARGWAA